MGVSPAEVYLNPTSRPSCTGQSIINVMHGVARPFTSQFQGRVDERLSYGSIVIRSLRPTDAGFYVVCNESSNKPVRIILLNVTELQNISLAPSSALPIATLGLEMATVHWSRANTPDCRGPPIIIVLDGEPRANVSSLQGRVEKTLLNGSVVIRRIQGADGGFYTVCDDAKKSRITLHLTVTDTPRAVTRGPTSAGLTAADEKQTRHRGCLVAAVVLVVGIAAAAAVSILVKKKRPQHQSFEVRPCRGSSEEEAGQSPEPLHPHLQPNGDTAVVQVSCNPPTSVSTGEEPDHQETAQILLERNDPEGRNVRIASSGTRI
ncbi:uncharacterized protein [Ambystoma mexicanum]|uniref:uncharacterized protein n=1 Tax=Ambystoma mexicanum TaxID=8296 RepID=UPI0037E8B55E